MTKCNTYPISLSSCKRRLVQASFSGGDTTSDGGSVLLREMDRHLNLTPSVARVLEDNRDKKKFSMIKSASFDNVYMGSV